MDTMIYLVGYFQLAAAFLWPFALLGVTLFTFVMVFYGLGRTGRR